MFTNKSSYQSIFYLQIENVPLKKAMEKVGERRLEVKLTRSKLPSPPRLRGGTKRSSEDDISLESLVVNIVLNNTYKNHLNG